MTTLPINNLSVPELDPWLLLDITTECNLRCKHCHLWRTTEGPTALTTVEKLRVISEFKEWKQTGKVILAGGETFLKPEEVLQLAKHCAALGLHSTVLTNATLLNRSLIEALLDSGISQVSVSLDAPTAESYDFTRGVPGTFEKAVSSLRSLVGARNDENAPVEIYVNTILKRGTFSLIHQHLDFVRGLGVDGIFFFPLEATFANSGSSDPFYEREKLLPDEGTASAFEYLLGYQESKGFIANSREDLAAIRANIFSGANDRCAAGERNIVVDLNGNLRFCHLMEEKISNGRILGSVRQGTLKELCTTSEANRFRELMSFCEQPCASLNCNRPTVV